MSRQSSKTSLRSRLPSQQENCFLHLGQNLQSPLPHLSEETVLPRQIRSKLPEAPARCRSSRMKRKTMVVASASSSEKRAIRHQLQRWRGHCPITARNISSMEAAALCPGRMHLFLLSTRATEKS